MTLKILRERESFPPDSFSPDLLVPYAKLVARLIYHLNTIKKMKASTQIINNSDCKSSYDIQFHFLW